MTQKSKKSKPVRQKRKQETPWGGASKKRRANAHVKVRYNIIKSAPKKSGLF